MPLPFPAPILVAVPLPPLLPRLPVALWRRCSRLLSTCCLGCLLCSGLQLFVQMLCLVPARPQVLLGPQGGGG